MRGEHVANPPSGLAAAPGTCSSAEPAEPADAMDADEVARRRATIERVKGALMFAYRLTPQQAFDLLVWRSQESNVKLYALAAAIEARISDVDLPSEARSSFDRIVHGAHEDVQRR